jgi:hypothetical protein
MFEFQDVTTMEIQMARRNTLRPLLPVLVAILTVPALGQTVRTVTIGEDGKPVVVESPAAAPASTAKPEKPGSTPGKPSVPNAKPGESPKGKGDDDKKKDGKEGESESKVIKRPLTPESPLVQLTKKSALKRPAK